MGGVGGVGVGVTAKESRVSFWDDEHVPKLIVVMPAHPQEHTKNHQVINFM